ncbi:hypothetical protein IV203_006041 [Nitzschia inconspicua]|uniref:Uncharacterized protein n=1 Tax=Nitzschia inconspicua TaxID=303405 RepID=A0A9K3KNX2_9STRA|nr:hypothetical protein IV203_006041 [Nitzschia inconspicua]
MIDCVVEWMDGSKTLGALYLGLMGWSSIRCDRSLGLIDTVVRKLKIEFKASERRNVSRINGRRARPTNKPGGPDKITMMALIFDLANASLALHLQRFVELIRMTTYSLSGRLQHVTPIYAVT